MLKDKFKEDQKTALRAGDSGRRTVIGMLLSGVQNKELEKRSKLSKSGTPADQLESASQLTDDEVLDVLSSEIKKRKEAITTFEQGGRPELAEGEKTELAMLMQYMPEQISEDEVKKLIADAMAATGAAGPKDMGKVMGAISGKIKGRFDGTRASQIVKEVLGA